MQDGYTDDINGIDKQVRIRPFSHDTEGIVLDKTKN